MIIKTWHFPTPKEHIELQKEKRKIIPDSTIRWLGGKKAVERLTNRQKWMEIIKERGLNKCSQCGYDKCFAAIDFHHTDPEKKRMQISSLMNFAPCKGALSELDRCIPLCKNCHAELHYERGKDMKSSPVKIISQGGEIYST